MINALVTAYVTPIFWIDEHVNLPESARSVLGLALVPIYVGGLLWTSLEPQR